MENILMFHNDWITYDYKNLVINEYPNKYFTPSTFLLINRAKSYIKILGQMFLSGGMNSQAIVLDLSWQILMLIVIFVQVIMVIIINLIIYLSHSFVVNTTNLKVIDLEC